MAFEKPLINPVRVEDILRRNNLTIADLAKRMDSDYYAVWRQVQGVLTVKSATKIAQALGVPLWQLFISPEDAYDYYIHMQNGTPIEAKRVYCPRCGHGFTM